MIKKHHQDFDTITTLVAGSCMYGVVSNLSRPISFGRSSVLGQFFFSSKSGAFVSKNESEKLQGA